MTIGRWVMGVAGGINIVIGWAVLLFGYHPEPRDIAAAAFFGAGLALLMWAVAK